MAFEQVHEAIESKSHAEPESSGPGAEASTGNGDLAPDSSSSAPDSGKAEAILDLAKAEKFLFDGKEMTAEDLRKSILRQQDYTKKTQSIAEERRKFESERQEFIKQQEQEQQYLDNYEIDIQNVLKDPSKEQMFKKIYPERFHAALDKALANTFGDQNNPKRNDSVLEQRLRSVEGKFQQQELERARQSFESEVSKNSEILDSNISRLSVKYPMADEDSVLARAEYMAQSLKKDASFNDNFSKLMEKLYKENNDFHEKRYLAKYKEKQTQQKQANSRGRDIGRGGATPGAEPTKMKLKDVKNHILSQMGQN